MREIKGNKLSIKFFYMFFDYYMLSNMFFVHKKRRYLTISPFH